MLMEPIERAVRITLRGKSKDQKTEKQLKGGVRFMDLG
jgi:hypothetical protein